MDKNSVFGLLIIGGILIGWMYLTKPTQQELAKQQMQYDSVAKFEKLILQENENVSPSALNATNKLGVVNAPLLQSDSLIDLANKQNYGDFACASRGENKVITIENEMMKLNLFTKGGRIASVELKKYKTFGFSIRNTI